MKSIFSPLGLLIFGLGLVGCASMRDSVKDFTQVKVTTNSFQEMSFAPLPASKRVGLKFTLSSPSFSRFGYSKLYQAFRLPEYQPGQNLRFVSRTKQWKEGSGTILPRVVFLDERLKEIGKAGPTVYFKQETLIAGSNYVGRVVIPKQARHVVIYPGGSELWGSEEDFSYPIGFSSSWFSPGGNLSVEYRTDEVATISDTVLTEAATGSVPARLKIFAVTSVNGLPVTNAQRVNLPTPTVNGYYYTKTETRYREVPVHSVRLGLIGTHETAGIFQSIDARIAGHILSVSGDVTLSLEPFTHYQVRGKLEKGNSTVWLAKPGVDTPVGKLLSSGQSN